MVERSPCWLCLVLRHAAKRPEGLLQVLGQGREAFPAENHADMFPAAVDHDEVIEQVRERLACYHHAQLVSMGEVGLAHVFGAPWSGGCGSGGR